DEKHLNPEPLANRPMPETRKTKSSLILWNKIVSFKNQLRSNNPKTNDHHNQSLFLANRPMSEPWKTNMSLILWNKIVSFKNQLTSDNPMTVDDHRNPLSFENCPKSRTLKTILMIPVFVLLSIVLFRKNGIFSRDLYQPVLIDMPRPHDSKPSYRLKNQSVGISPETNFAGKQFMYPGTGPISALWHLLVTSEKTNDPLFTD
ncbi:MAG TPA: hypothetical protein VKR53_15225, partial [Puia sp.]|nr:hypothetical protein [Puia sp.]